MRTSKPPAPPPLDDDDAALFRDAIGPVRELPAPPEPVRPPPPRPVARQRAADESAALAQMRERPFDVEGGETLLYRRDEVAPRVLRRLRRGLYVVQDEVDLHGLTLVEAERVLRAFLQDAHAGRRGCVRIVHGKGLHTDGGLPVLKGMVERLLTQRRDVLAFASAPAAAGGSGAVLVLLAR